MVRALNETNPQPVAERQDTPHLSRPVCGKYLTHENENEKLKNESKTSIHYTDSLDVVARGLGKCFALFDVIWSDGVVRSLCASILLIPVILIILSVSHHHRPSS